MERDCDARLDRTAVNRNGFPPLHILTCEYPPQSGGVSDYTFEVAKGLAKSGQEVHVWCPDAATAAPAVEHILVHRDLGSFRPSDLLRTGRALNRFPARRRVLVQWVPHGFGLRALNLPFCCWLWARSVLRRDRVEVMVHEPYLPFKRNSWRQTAAAVVHRIMTILVLSAADRLWISTPKWREYLRPYMLGRRLPLDWLPVPSNVPVLEDAARIEAVRRRYIGNGILVGHFGTFGYPIVPLLDAVLPRLAQQADNVSFLFIGGRGDAYCERLIREYPGLQSRIHATGQLNARDPELSLHISACDLMLQPYPDGVTSRRTTVTAPLAHGRPVVTTSGALTEPFWEKSAAIALYPVEDVAAGVAATMALVRDAGERRRLGAAGQQLYARQFDISNVLAAVR